MTSEMDINYIWYWLNNIKGVGRKTIKGLMDYFGSAEDIYYADKEHIEYFFEHNNLRIDISDFINSKNPEYIINSFERLTNKQISFISRDSDIFPKRLVNIPDAPYGLYLKGKLPDPEKKAVAIIGARNSTHYGREMARIFARELAGFGIVIVSGLARGIDGMAHRGALEAEQYTLGVLGCGIDQIYPKENYDLFIQMEKNGGIMSESNLDIAPNACLFPQRNRLISGMADGILVIEAREKSGTFITVDQGLEQGKEIFALPGRAMDKESAGCNNLIKMGAHMVTESSDILEILNIDDDINEDINNFVKSDIEKNSQMHNRKYIKTSISKVDDIKNSLAPTEKIVYSVLSVEPKFIDDIICETKIAPQVICIILNRLSVDGIIDEPFRNYYSIKL